ncbi:hypothetical protein M6B38_388605 [Iris pallida]|uniref:Uncharacterized protein n=1 Tax=Iris pallida TaxID=29817 RepID=A0AAX6G184_IRIPA|nr:hypothetical protein M6B38_388605 [Iris pallida]
MSRRKKGKMPSRYVVNPVAIVQIINSTHIPHVCRAILLSLIAIFGCARLPQPTTY